jgi:hypothetical protein
MERLAGLGFRRVLRICRSRLELSRGMLLRWIGADDWLWSHALSEGVRALEQGREAVGVTTGSAIHNPGRAQRLEQIACST